MELTTLDKELLDGLQVLTDGQIGRVQAHLAAGLPMKVDYGWESDTQPACFGCLVGTAMSRADKQNSPSHYALFVLAIDTFPTWVAVSEGGGLPRYVLPDAPLSRLTLDRLAALLDMEWSRRHPLPAASSQEAILPTLKEAVLSA